MEKDETIKKLVRQTLATFDFVKVYDHLKATQARWQNDIGSCAHVPRIGEVFLLAEDVMWELAEKSKGFTVECECSAKGFCASVAPRGRDLIIRTSYSVEESRIELKGGSEHGED